MLKGSDGARLHQELVHTHQTHNVPTRHIFNGLHITAHHQDCPLDGFQVQVLLLPRGVVGPHDPDLQTSGHQPREHTTEGVEPTFVGGWHHFGNVHHEGTFGITAFNAHRCLVVRGPLIQELTAVFLGRHGRRQMDGDHLQQSVPGW